MFYRTLYRVKMFFLNPSIFFTKLIGKILLKIIPSPKGVVKVNIGGHTIDTLPSRNYWWKSMYLGYCDVEISHNINKFLKKGGVFIDVGGGIGYFSAVASKIVGFSGQVHCFEPFPPDAEAIRKMIKNNPNSNIILNDCALGSDNGVYNYYIS